MIRIIFILFALPIIALPQQKSPCLDARYVELKKKKLDEMSDREYSYFLKKDKECSKYLSSKKGGLSDADLSINVASDSWDEKYREVRYYKNRQKFDLIFGGSFYALTAIIGLSVDLADDDDSSPPIIGDGPPGSSSSSGELDAPMLFIPVVGPFFVAFQDEVAEKYKMPLIFSGLIQSAAIVDFVITSKKRRLLESKNLSFNIDPNPLYPSLSLTYSFK